MFIFRDNTIMSLWRWSDDEVIIEIHWCHTWYPLLHQHSQVNWKRYFIQLHKTMSGFIKIAEIQTNKDCKSSGFCHCVAEVFLILAF